MVYTCGIILLSQDASKVLLLHPTNHAPDVWSIPKGVPDEGEEHKNAAVRELEEETGIRFYDAADSFSFVGHYKYPHGRKTLAAYGAVQKRDLLKPITCSSTFNDKGVIRPECDAHAWMPLYIAPYFLNAPQKAALAEYVSLLKIERANGECGG